MGSDGIGVLDVGIVARNGRDGCSQVWHGQVRSTRGIRHGVAISTGQAHRQSLFGRDVVIDVARIKPVVIAAGNAANVVVGDDAGCGIGQRRQERLHLL